MFVKDYSEKDRFLNLFDFVFFTYISTGEWFNIKFEIKRVCQAGRIFMGHESVSVSE